MTGTRDPGLPRQHRLALETARNASPIGTTGGDQEALTGFLIHDVNDH